MQIVQLLEFSNANVNVVVLLQQLKNISYGLNLEILGRLPHETKGITGNYTPVLLHVTALHLDCTCRAGDIGAVYALLPPFTRCSRSTLAGYRYSMQECRIGVSAAVAKQGPDCATRKRPL
jgi:hypothetical protein